MAYTTIDDPSAHFQIALYTGTGSSHSITNDGNSDLQPDFVWIKERDGTGQHGAFDSSRGVTKELKIDEDGMEATASQSVTAFNSDGFTVGTAGDYNGSNNLQVAWQWKANGGSTSSNTTGDITSTVQANTTAGFSIITYSASGSADDTMGHGLSAAPQVYWCKARTYNGGVNWIAEWSAFTSGSPNLNLSRAPLNYGGDSPLMTAQATTITHTTARAETNHTGTHVVYCWTPIQGFSKFGSYTGNGNADGPFVYTGFKPRWIMWKATSRSGDWDIYDTARDTYNLSIKELLGNENNAESSADVLAVDILSNGFKLRTSNANGNEDAATYIYMAFAENPFVTSGGVPCTAR